MNQIVDYPRLAIEGVPLIRVWDHSPGGGTWVLPGLSTVEAFPTMWGALHLAHNDWVAEANSYSLVGADQGAAESVRLSLALDALEILKPRFILSLYSYISIFYVLENGFCVLFDELKHLHGQLGLRSKIHPKPKRPAYLYVMDRIRDHTVVHWGGPRKKHALNSRAGRYWGFSWDSEASSLVDLRFGGISLVGAAERQLLSLSETHGICTKYLAAYDSRCAELQERIVSNLPKKNQSKGIFSCDKAAIKFVGSGACASSSASIGEYFLQNAFA